MTVTEVMEFSWELILEKLKKNSITLEIGCFNGSTVEKFLNKVNSRIHIGIDPYIEYTSENGYPVNPQGYGDQSDHNERYLNLERNHLFENRFKLIRSTSDLTLPKLPKKLFSTIYIDGAHYYTQVKKDIINCIDLIEDDGLIILDDYLIGPPKPGFGVNQAVEEIVAEKRLFVAAASDDKRFKKIILTKSESARSTFLERIL